MGIDDFLIQLVKYWTPASMLEKSTSCTKIKVRTKTVKTVIPLLPLVMERLARKKETLAFSSMIRHPACFVLFPDVFCCIVLFRMFSAVLFWFWMCSAVLLWFRMLSAVLFWFRMFSASDFFYFLCVLLCSRLEFTFLFEVEDCCKNNGGSQNKRNNASFLAVHIES